MFSFSFIVVSIYLKTVYSQSITMSGGSYSYQGRIEIYWYTSGCWLFCEDRWEWGTVCDDFFDMNDANVACRSMGYVGAVSYHGSAYFGQGGGPVWLDDINCGGWESYLWHCSTPGWGNVNCGHGEDVGVTCDINHCSYYAPCQNGAACTDLVGTYSCQCVTGYTGGNCEINIDDCATNYCVHGSCVDGINTYSCSCYAGYTATYCDENIDECSSSPCQNGAPCIDGVNGYTCSCLAGYSGTHCETNIDECSSSPCQNGAMCNDGVNGYTCSCLAGYDGTHCETDIDECASSPCQNGATCVDDVNQYSCTCVQGNEGTHCEIDTDECASGPCLNGGTCIDQFNGYVCACVPWYYEYNCASLDNSYSQSTLNRYTGNALIDKAYQISKARSQIECMRTCLGSTGCESGNFITSSGACEISTETKADHASDFISNSGTVYFEKP